MHIDNFFGTRDISGLIAKGRVNSSAERVFDQLSRLLSDFYFSKELVFVSRIFDEKKTRYSCPVYNPEEMASRVEDAEIMGEVVGQRVITLKAAPVSLIEIVRLNARRRTEPEPDADYPIYSSETETNRFLLYFNSLGEPDGIARNEFAHFLKERGYRVERV